ncbi:MAG: hypothetical protein U9Q82_06420 [Chloroflexota bacterium]|nr:hypothetical protein [Chloroflexota bacterium]
MTEEQNATSLNRRVLFGDVTFLPTMKAIASTVRQPCNDKKYELISEPSREIQ